MLRRRYNRRTFLSAAGILATCGCLGYGGEADDRNAVSIQIDNNTVSDRRVTVAATNAETEFEKRYEVPAGERTVDGGVLPAGTYEVTVEVEGVGTETEAWDMAGCKTNDIEAVFSEQGISIGATCYDD